MRTVKLMIYCKIKERYDDHAVYNVGATLTDMTGQLTFFRDERLPVLDKQADEVPVLDAYIARLYRKYAHQIHAGVFADKMAYEIG